MTIGTPQDFVDEARKMIGVSFVHQGRSINGIDCVGLVVLSARAIGIDTSADIINYSRLPHGVLLPILDECMTKVSDANEYDKWQVGDVLVMKFINEPTHVGIWTGSTLIHTYSNLGKVVEHRLDDKWKRRVVAAYRLKEFM
jgi:cell wall-associated NlpC family hydrolase